MAIVRGVHRSAASVAVAALVAGVALSATAGLGAADPAELGGWKEPGCASVVGTEAVTFTADDGRTVAPSVPPRDSQAPTYGLVALSEANALFAEHGGALLRSDDAGCIWHPIGTVDETFVRLVAGPGGRAYGYSDSRGVLIRLEGSTVTPLSSPTAEIVGLGVDPANPDRLRLGGTDGSLWESSDAGATFRSLGTARVDESEPRPLRRFGVDPLDFDHLLVTGVHFGVAVSFDGGATWNRSAGLLPGNADFVNVFSMAMTSDGTTIWVNGLVLKRIRPGELRTERYIFRSTDEGRSFVPLLDDSKDVTILNAPAMAAHPTDPNVVYFSGPGSQLYRFDAATRMATTTEVAHGVDALVFSPANPKVLYLGLAAKPRSDG